MSPLDHIRIVLVNPIYGGNVGSACRAMMNMGLSRLVLVNPRPGMNMEDAAQMACHAGDVLQNRRVYDTTAEADVNADSCSAVRSKPGAYNGVWHGGLEDAVKPDAGKVEPDEEEKF